MSKLTSYVAVLSFCLGLGMTQASAAGDKTVTLNLGGKFCEFYPDEVAAALRKLPGVKSADTKQGQKFAVVQYDASQVNTDKMIAAVKGVKQEGMWHCEATVK